MPRSKPKLSVADVMAMYPTEESCLVALFLKRYGANPKCPRCGSRGRFFRLNSYEKAWECGYGCGRHLSPTAGTAMAYTRVPLRSWLWVAATLMLENRALGSAEVMAHCGVSKVSADTMLNGCRAYVAMEMLAK